MFAVRYSEKNNAYTLHSENEQNIRNILYKNNFLLYTLLPGEFYPLKTLEGSFESIDGDDIARFYFSDKNYEKKTEGTKDIYFKDDNTYVEVYRNGKEVKFYDGYAQEIVTAADPQYKEDYYKYIYDLSMSNEEYFGMGTTITGIVITSKGCLSINCGDSRTYGFIDNKIFKLTEDHTLVNQMLAKGQISYEESLNHPKRHYLVRAVGIFDDVKFDVHKVKDMDYYLVCSDGLHGYVSEAFNEAYKKSKKSLA